MLRLLAASVVAAVVVGASPAVAAEDEAGSDDPPQPDLSFVAESVTVYLRGATVPDDAEVDEELRGAQVGLVSLAVKNEGDAAAAIDDVQITFRALTELGEPIGEARLIRTQFPDSLEEEGYPARKVTTFTVRLLGLQPGWDGLVVLQPERDAGGDDSVTFSPDTMTFSVVNRSIGFRWLLAPSLAVAVFLGVVLVSRRGDPDRLNLSDAVRSWGDDWTIKDNVVPVFAFATGALAALAGATGKLDRLAGVDIGLFVGLNILLAGIAGSTALLVRLGQKAEGGSLKPRVGAFWIAMATSVFAATGILSATWFLVSSMTFSNEWAPILITAGLAVAMAATVWFASQLTAHQSSGKKAPQPIDEAKLDSAIAAAGKAYASGKPFRHAVAAALDHMREDPGGD